MNAREGNKVKESASVPEKRDDTMTGTEILWPRRMSLNREALLC